MDRAKDNRLDEILVELGFVTEDQVKRALKLQMDQGGRLGTHLLQRGAVTESQLAQALALQYRVAPFVLNRHRVSADLAGRLPRAFRERYQALPMDFNPSNGVLSLVMADPEDAEAVREMRRLISCSEVEIYVTPEATFAQLAQACAPADSGEDGGRTGIELPDLFAAAEDAGDAPEALAAAPDGALEQVLMISDRLFLKNFLDPVFEREGRRLLASSDPGEIRTLLAGGDIDQVLVARDMAGRLDAWIHRGDVPRPGVVAEFSSVSSALLDNPVPYAAMLASLHRSLRLVAEAHAAVGDVTLPFDLLRRDVGELGTALDLGRLACDGLQLATQLIVPAPADADDDIDWKHTLIQARTLRFPWKIADLLKAFAELRTGRVNLEEFGRGDGELALAAQILAVVWRNRVVLESRSGGTGDDALERRTELREQCRRLAASEVVESYLVLLERSSEELHAPACHQLLVVGGDHPLLRRFTTRLRHLGYRPVHVNDLQEARSMCERHPPSAVVIHDASFPDDILPGPQVLRTEARVLLYALTEENDPSRVLNLLDAGFDDVFSLPHDMDLIAARLRKSLREAAGPDAEAAVDGAFGASFTALPFTDLLQTLNQSQRSVRIRLVRGTGEEAVVHLDRGRLVHAACDRVTGPEAIYSVLGWEDAGEFRVEPVEEFPPANISQPLEAVLMEGCRLLDELMRT